MAKTSSGSGVSTSVSVAASIVCLLMPLIFNSCNDTQSAGTPAASSAPTAPSESSGNPGTQAFPQVSLSKVAGGFANPTFIGNAGDGSNRLFVVEQGGTVKIIKNGTVLSAPFLDISPKVMTGGERGLFVIIFPPGFGEGKQHFYVNYTGETGNGDTFISRYRITENPDAADPADEQILLAIDQPFANHNGGQMAFGPDGYLYIGMGDGGSAGDPTGNAQNPGSLLGKMLRLDVESNPTGAYAIPSNNPFVSAAGYRPEIWALGLRNPWRFSFDRETGNLFIADVGQDAFEEVDRQPAGSSGGENYGWNVTEAFECYNSASCDTTGLTMPVFSYARADGNCSVTGGSVYRGREFPDMQGLYLYGDYCSGRIWGLRQIDGVWKSELLLDSEFSISTFGEDEAGNVYVADHARGGIYKVIVP